MSAFVFRPLSGPTEYAAAVALQRQTWGETFSELVPASMLKITQTMGGVASGAFDGDRLVGLVFGLSGLREGRLAHWSDLLAVDPDYRTRGLGRLLKLHQRELLQALGIELMLWTFDPLEARNAHLNLTRLGATSRTYIRDAYGPSDSPLHRGIGTDRLLAEWDLSSPRVATRAATPAAPTDASPRDDDAPFLAPPQPADTGFPRPGGRASPPAGGEEGARVRLAVPADIQALKQVEPALAREWRLHVREALEGAFERGYVAVDLRKMEGGLGAYTLSRGF